MSLSTHKAATKLVDKVITFMNDYELRESAIEGLVILGRSNEDAIKEYERRQRAHSNRQIAEMEHEMWNMDARRP